MEPELGEHVGQAAPPHVPAAQSNSRVIKALSDWLELLGGPSSLVFTDIVEHRNWSRLLKQLTLVVVLSALILGVTAGVVGSTGWLAKAGEFLLMSKPAAVALITGTILAISYSSLARLFGIIISLSDSFFVFLSLALPWLPIFACFRAAMHLPYFPGISIVTIFLPIIVALKPINNVCRGVATRLQCSIWRVRASIWTPILLLLGLIIWMHH